MDDQDRQALRAKAEADARASTRTDWAVAKIGKRWYYVVFNWDRYCWLQHEPENWLIQDGFAASQDFAVFIARDLAGQDNAIPCKHNKAAWASSMYRKLHARKPKPSINVETRTE